MPKVYPQDLRERAIAHWLKTGSKSETARVYNLNRRTLYNWIALYEEQGHSAPKPSAVVGVKHIITDLKAFETYVKAQVFDTAKQLRAQYLIDHPDIKISYSAFCCTLHRIGWSFKKNANLQRSVYY